MNGNTKPIEKVLLVKSYRVLPAHDRFLKSQKSNASETIREAIEMLMKSRKNATDE